MSGPKVSSYELEQRRLAELRRQQEEELRRRMEEERRRRIEMDCRIMEKSKAEANQLLRTVKGQCQELITRGRVMQQPIDSPKIDQLDRQIQAFLDRYSNTKKLSQDAGNAVTCTQQLRNLRILVDGVQKTIREENERLDEINRKVARAELTRHMERKSAAASDKAAAEKAAQAAVNDLITKITSELTRLSEDVPSAIAESREKIRDQFQLIQSCFRESPEQQTRMLRNLYEHDVARLVHIADEWRELEPLRQQCRDMCSVLNTACPNGLDTMRKSELLREIDQFNLRIEINELQKECIALYQMLDVKMPPALQGMNKAQLQQLRDQLFEVQLEQRGRAYIAQAVEETMHEMGYNLVASKSVNYTNEHLYIVHDDTVLRVKHAPNGQISMAVGLGTTEANHGLTYTERDRLIPEMQAFCGKFEEIQSKLKEKGVLLKQNIILRPAEGRYAQAINISEFGITSLPGANMKEVSGTNGYSENRHSNVKLKYLEEE